MKKSETGGLVGGCTVADDFYDEKAAARILTVHPRTLRRMRKQRKLDYYRTPSGRIRYRLDDLLKAAKIEHFPAIVRDCPHLAASAPYADDAGQGQDSGDETANFLERASSAR